MKRIPIASRALALFVATILLSACATHRTEIRVMTSGGFTAAYDELTPQFERATQSKVLTAYGASQGGAPDSIPSRLQRGEPVDIVILAGPALDELIKQGKVVPGSRVDLVRSSIGMVVRKGAPKPDISTVEALKRTLLEAKSIAYSASASGVYLSTELFPRLGIAEQIKAKSKRIESERVGTVVARGDAEIGFQQVSELLPIAAWTMSDRCRPRLRESLCSRPVSPQARRSRKRPRRSSNSSRRRPPAPSSPKQAWSP